MGQPVRAGRLVKPRNPQDLIDVIAWAPGPVSVDRVEVLERAIRFAAIDARIAEDARPEPAEPECVSESLSA